MPEKPDALVAPLPRAEMDAYEAHYMADVSTLFRSKARSSWQGPVGAGAMSLFFIVWCTMHAQPIFGVVLAAATALLGLFFAVLRVKVSTTSVDIQYGMLGPKIPIDSIDSVEAIVHDHRSPLRWGISLTLRREWLYTIAGDEGRAVKIVWRNSRGRQQVHIIGSHEPERLAQAILDARAALEKRALVDRADSDDAR